MAENARDPRDSHGGQSRSEYHGVPANALPLTASEDRQWATISHFGGILGCVPALLIYLIFRDRGPFTAQESKEALNFSLPPTIAIKPDEQVYLSFDQEKLHLFDGETEMALTA